LSYSPARFSFLWKSPFTSILCERCVCGRTGRTSSVPSFRSSSSCSAWWNNSCVCSRYNEGSRFHAWLDFLIGLIVSRFSRFSRYSRISVTVPAPTVRPPSRMANRSAFSIATSAISSISRFALSPGITISTPVGSFAVPVTSVVRK